MGVRHVRKVRRTWPETVELARRLGVPALRFKDFQVVDEHRPHNTD